MSIPPHDEESPRPHSRETMGGLAKGLAIIELFDGRRAQMTAAEAARATGTSRATARRCLLTLEELGYVTRGEGQSFVAGSRMMRLGRGYSPPASLAEAAQPLLERVRDELREPVALACLEDAQVYMIARAESARIVTTGVRAGGRLPLYCSATGRVLTSELGEAELERLVARIRFVAHTPKTCVTRERFLALVEKARREGFACSDEEMEVGMRSMAIPLRGPDGVIRFCLSMSTSSARTTLRQMEERYLPILRRHVQGFEQLVADLFPEGDRIGAGTL